MYVYIWALQIINAALGYGLFIMCVRVCVFMAIENDRYYFIINIGVRATDRSWPVYNTREVLVRNLWLFDGP